MERKAINFELKDIDKEKRTAVIGHAVYDNIDRTRDVSRKGMFNKSWTENKGDINFYLNHNDEQAPGKVTDVFEEGNTAYTKAWLGTHTLGNDVLIMMDEGVIKKASFGYIVQKKNYIEVKGVKVRELKEVQHLETSVLTKIPANPLAGVVSVTKSLFDLSEVKQLTPNEQGLLKTIVTDDQNILMQLVSLSGTLDVNSDLYMWITYVISRRADLMGDLRSQLRYNSGELKSLKSHVTTLEKFCSNTKASDECIKSVLLEIDNAKELISEYNTVFTQADEKSLEPITSVEGEGFLDALKSFKKTILNTN